LRQTGAVARWRSCSRPEERNTVERCINKIRAWRGLATRYDKTPESYMAGLQLRGAIIWLRSLGPAS
jgi:transposase